MIWWLTQSGRLAYEKSSMTDLEGGTEWLQISKWYANEDLSMCVDFQVSHLGKTYALKMVYPSVFPDAPPMIFTQDLSRISFHQYGPEGELCLEYRPDNWQQAITGADMVASCHRLISAEHPEPEQTIHAQSAHVGSLGRDLRSKSFRFLLTEKGIAALNGLRFGSPEKIAFNERIRSASTALTAISAIAYIGEKDSPIWVSDLILPESFGCIGFVVRIPDIREEDRSDCESLRALLKKQGIDWLNEFLLDTEKHTYLLLGDEDNWNLLWFNGAANARRLRPYTNVHVAKENRRTPDCFDTLGDKSIGLIGCGSLGSKIAASLCRSGVGKFVLIDEDIFFPGNVTRNELSLADVGLHKADALKDRLVTLNPQCEVRALRLSIGGQESSRSMSGTLESLGDCDILIDATAEPVAFNIVASISLRQMKPMIWGEVFAGGIGGLVARARPKADPTPLASRNQIQAWCQDQNIEWKRHTTDGLYNGRDEEGRLLIADDAEVSIIASHIVRFATDILVRPDDSIFPVSAYLVGFSSEWIFEQPFETFPINLLPDDAWSTTPDPITEEEMIELVKEHLPPPGERQ
jgi:ubiquitin-protein ligase|tara:strand:- start:12187 stop:13923 length:1737 start_codon:yes stop_codon:yes gene_type:complete